MKTAIIFFLVGTLLVGAAPNQVNQTSTLVTSARYAESELLVKFAGGPESAAAVMAHTAVGSQAIRHFRACGWQQVRLPDGMSVLEGIAAYRALGDFVTAEPNYVRRLYATPDDPRFPSQWALQRISAPGAWNNTTGSTDVVVALIDTGVEYTHEDLAGNMWRNPGESGLDESGHDKATNGMDDDGNGYVDDLYGIDACNHDNDPMDDSPASAYGYGHGTGCAGIIGAVGNNGKGIAGVNWEVQIMVLKSHGANEYAYDSDVIECFEYVIQMRHRG